MLYDFSNTFEVQKARNYLEQLIKEKAKAQMSKKRPPRSVQQNSYLHAVLTVFAIEYGEKREYVKQEIFKKQVNPETFKTEFVNKKTGECREDWISTKDLDTKQLSFCIERFRNYASINGIYIMSADEYKDNYFYFKQLEEQNKMYL